MSVPLPPLPPAADDAYRPGGHSVADLADTEHRQLLGLAGQVDDPELDGEGRREVVEVLTAAVSRHLSAEEQYLLPAVRAALPEAADRVEAVLAGDAALLTVLKAVTGPQDGTLAEVAERVRHHVDEVRVLTARLREVTSDADLIRLGNRWEIAEEAAPTRPHPGTPASPPWNRVVEPALGVVDKVRDAVTGRRTYPADLHRDSGE